MSCLGHLARLPEWNSIGGCAVRNWKGDTHLGKVREYVFLVKNCVYTSRALDFTAEEVSTIRCKLEGCHEKPAALTLCRAFDACTNACSGCAVVRRLRKYSLV